MPSTYSSNLQLNLMGTGDQPGTWGTTSNFNFGTLVEQAISSYVVQQFTTDTDVTLYNGANATDGGSNNTPGTIYSSGTTSAPVASRNMYIECTSAVSLTATRNLIVPNYKKLYFIYNNTTGGQSITVKVSGQTGVTVPNGSKLLLVCNGTDVVNATSYSSSSGTVSSVSTTGTVNGITLTGGPITTTGTITLGGTLTGVSLTTQVTGTLPVANGGTGITSFGTGVATALGNNVTGSGGIVLATGPTISSPNISGPTISGTTTLSGLTTMSGVAFQEQKQTISASNIDLSTGNYFSKTISATTTFTVSNTPTTGTASTFILDLTNGGSQTINWWTGVKWASGTAPTLTASGRDVLGFFTYDGGTTWNGLVLGKAMA